MAHDTTGHEDIFLYDFIVDSTKPHVVILNNPPYKPINAYANSSLDWIEYCRSVHRGRGKSPEQGRFRQARHHNTIPSCVEYSSQSIQPYEQSVAKLLTALRTIDQLIHRTGFVQNDIHVGRFERSQARAESVTGGSYMSSNPDGDSDDDCRPNVHLVTSNILGRDVHTAAIEPGYDTLLWDAYDRVGGVGIPRSQAFYWRIFAACRCIIKNPHPRFQAITVEDLPPEVLGIIIAFMDTKYVRELGATSKYMRDLCTPSSHKTANFVVRYDTATHAEYREMGLQNSNALFSAAATATASFVRSVDDFLTFDTYVRNVRELGLLNHFLDIFPGHTITPPPSLLDTSVYGRALDAIGTLIDKTHPKVIQMRGFGLTLEVLDAIGRSPSTHSVNFERCYPCVAYPSPVSVTRKKDRKGYALPLETQVLLDPTFHHVTTLSLGFGPETATHLRTWNVIGLCVSLNSLYCYTIDVGRELAFPPVELYDAVNFARFQDLVLEGCSTAFAKLVAACVIGANEDRAANRRGRWTRVKIRTRDPVSDEDVDLLIEYIGTYQRGIRALVLEGLRTVPSALINGIAAACPRLEGLSIARRARDNSITNATCLWDEDMENYCTAVGEFFAIEYFCGNFLWYAREREHVPEGTEEPDEAYPPSEYGHPDYEETYGTFISRDVVEPQPPWRESPNLPLWVPATDLVRWDPFSLLTHFQDASSTLTTIAVRSEATEFIATSGRNTGRFKVKYDPTRPDLNKYNPPLGYSWESVPILPT